MNPNPVTASRVKYLRELQRMSMDELSERCGYKSRASVFKIEHMKADVDQENLAVLAAALNTTVRYLMGWTDDPNPSPCEELYMDIVDFVRTLNDADADKLRQLIRLTFGAEVL